VNAATTSPAPGAGATGGFFMCSSSPELVQATTATSRPHLRAGAPSPLALRAGPSRPMVGREPVDVVAPELSSCAPPPVPRDGPERVQEIRRRRALLLMALRRNPAFAIASMN
jgi:hypothetical protein